jgi:hypothetical protein
MGGSHANRCYRLIITRSTHDEAPHQTAALSVHQSSMLLHLSLASERSRRSDAMSHHEHDDDHVKVETIAVAVRGRALEGSSRRTRGRLYTRPSPLGVRHHPTLAAASAQMRIPEAGLLPAAGWTTSVQTRADWRDTGQGWRGKRGGYFRSDETRPVPPSCTRSRRRWIGSKRCSRSSKIAGRPRR